jgi:hypothetical protein
MAIGAPLVRLPLEDGVRHIGQLPTTKLVRLSGREDLAKVVVAAGSREPAPLDPVHGTSKASPSAGSPDRSSLHLRERNSSMKNRTRESCTSGSVRDEDGNILIYSAKVFCPGSSKDEGFELSLTEHTRPRLVKDVTYVFPAGGATLQTMAKNVVMQFGVGNSQQCLPSPRAYANVLNGSWKRDRTCDWE